MEQEFNFNNINGEERKKHILKSYGLDIEKAKYYKREGTPGNYKYYYSEAEYRDAKGGKKEDSKQPPKEMVSKKLKERVEAMSDKEAKTLVDKINNTKEKYGKIDEASKELKEVLENKLNKKEGNDKENYNK